MAGNWSAVVSAIEVHILLISLPTDTRSLSQWFWNLRLFRLFQWFLRSFVQLKWGHNDLDLSLNSRPIMSQQLSDKSFKVLVCVSFSDNKPVVAIGTPDWVDLRQNYRAGLVNSQPVISSFSKFRIRLPSPHLSRHLSLLQPFAPDLKLICFTNTFIRSLHGSFWTAFHGSLTCPILGSGTGVCLF